MASTYITKTMTAGNNNTLKFTFSAWVKRTGLSSNDGMNILSVSDEYIYLGFHADSLRMEIHDVDNVRIRSSAKFRDTNAWYHVVFTFDSTQATASDRMKMWVNNEQITSFSYSSYPSQNYGTYIGTNTQHSLGRRENDDSDYFDGIISHAHLTVGYTYTPSAFGEYDANGVWKIKTDVSVTYGTNGFFILKDGNSVTDQSGNGNNFTVAGGTLTDTLDCPANVFATFNPLHFGDAISTSYGAFSNGNTTYTSSQGGSPYPYTLSTLAPSSGKWYAEFKFPTVHSMMIGVSDGGKYQYTGDSANDAVLFFDGNFYPGNSSWGSAFSDNDIVGVAMDLDNMKIYWHKNGTYFQSGDPTSGATGTGAKNIPVGTTGVYHFVFGDSSSGTPVCNANFGNGYFGTTAVASAGTNASGNGIFEYDVPTGYTALCTKGLNGE